MKGRSLLLKAGEIAKITGGEILSGSAERICKGVSTDSRDIDRGNLFVPIIGGNFDGHDFIGKAVEQGAAVVLVQRDKSERFKCSVTDVPIIIVGDTLKSLGDIASFWRKQFDVPIVAVTGSSGKTTTKEMIASVVSLSRNILKNHGNFNNLIGLPLTLLQLNDGHKAVILEMGTNRRGEIERLTHIADPDVGIITNTGPAHLEGLKSLDLVVKEKGDLFGNMKNNGVAVVNRDDSAISDLLERWKGKSLTFGMYGNAFVTAEDVTVEGREGINFTLAIEGKRKRINIDAMGRHNVSDALAAAACSWALGIEYNQICSGLEGFKQLPGRMRLHRLKKGISLIDDTYNANPASTREAIETLNEIKGDNDIFVVMADMLELGDSAAKMHEEIGSLMARRGVKRIFLSGNLVMSLANGAKKEGLMQDQIVLQATPEMVVDQLYSFVKRGDFILVKGSRGMKMEQYVNAIITAFGED